MRRPAEAEGVLSRIAKLHLQSIVLPVRRASQIAIGAANRCLAGLSVGNHTPAALGLRLALWLTPKEPIDRARPGC